MKKIDIIENLFERYNFAVHTFEVVQDNIDDNDYTYNRVRDKHPMTHLESRIGLRKARELERTMDDGKISRMMKFPIYTLNEFANDIEDIICLYAPYMP